MSRKDTWTQVWNEQINEMKSLSTYKTERKILSKQSSDITVINPKTGKEIKVLNFCANNYLGLSDNQTLIDSAKKALDSHGLGLSSVRFICGTQDIHRELEKKIAEFHKTEDAILYEIGRAHV